MSEEPIEYNLNSIRAPIYLLCLHEERQTIEIANIIYQNTNFPKHRNTVYMYVDKLDGKEIMSRNLDTPGPPRMRQANVAIFDQTVIPIWMKLLEMDGDSHADIQTKLERLHGYLQLTTPFAYYFPEYLEQYIHGWSKIRNLPWETTLAVFLYYNQRILEGAWWIKHECKGKAPNANQLKDIYEEIFKEDREKHKWTAPPVRPYVIRALNKDIVPRENLDTLLEPEIDYQLVRKIARYMTEPGDVLNPNTISGELILLHFGVKDHHDGTNLKYLLSERRK